MAKIQAIVTGADGFTGRYVTKALSERGYHVCAITHRPVLAENLEGVNTVYHADLDDYAALKSIFAANAPDIVIHLAAISYVAHDDADAIYRTNLIGSRHLLEAILTSGCRPRAVLLASSANVYGNATHGAIDEDAVLAPANDYAVSKVAMEYMSRIYMDRLPIVLARPFNYTGIGQSESFLLPKIIGHFRRGANIIELGNLDVARDFSDVRMVAEAYCRLVETPGAVGQAINVCSGRAYTLREVIRLVSEISDRQIEVRVNPAFVRANEVKVLQGDRTRLDNILPNLLRVDIVDTLRWMIEAP